MAKKYRVFPDGTSLQAWSALLPASLKHRGEVSVSAIAIIVARHSLDEPAAMIANQ